MLILCIGDKNGFVRHKNVMFYIIEKIQPTQLNGVP